MSDRAFIITLIICTKCGKEIIMRDKYPRIDDDICLYKKEIDKHYIDEHTGGELK